MEISAIDTSAAIAANPSFTVSRAALFPVLDIMARKIIERRNTIPILSNVLIEASPSGELRLTGTNLDMELSATLPAEVEQPGAFTVSAATLRDIVKKADKGADIRFNADDGRVSIASGRIRQSLPTLPRDDFPMLAVADDLAMFELPAGFISGLAMVAPFICKEEARYYLNGVAMQARDIGQGEKLYCAATDGHTLATLSYDLPEAIAAMESVIIPRGFIGALPIVAKIAGDDTPIMEIGTSKARVTMGAMTLATKLIDGTFPDWTRVIPTGELERLIMPELETRLNPGKVEALKDVAPALSWELQVIDGAPKALVTSPSAPHWFAVLMGTSCHVAPKGYDWGHDAASYNKAREYAEFLRIQAGLPEFETVTPHCNGPVMVGVTYGEGGKHHGRTEQRQNWETLAMETVTIPAGYEYETGAYSIIIPQCDRTIHSDCRLESEGVTYPVATASSGKIHLSAETVRALQGPVDTSTHVHIPEYTMHRGKVVAIDGVPTDAMPAGYRLNVKPNEKQAKALRAASVAAFWSGDHATVASIAAQFEPTIAMLPDEVAAPVATPISEAGTAAPVSAELDSDGLPDAETCKAMLNAELVKHFTDFAKEQSAPETQEADAPATLAAPEPEIALCEPEIQPETAIEPCADPIAGVLERLARLEQALAERSAPVTPFVAMETITPLSGESKPKRTAAHIRAIMGYLAMRRERGNYQALALGWKEKYESALDDATRFRLNWEKSAADYLDIQKQRDDAQGEVQRLKALAVISNEHYCQRLDDIAAINVKRRRAVLSARVRSQAAWQLGRALVTSVDECERLKRVSYQQAGHIINLGERIDKAEQLLRSNGYWPDITVTAPDVIRMPQLAH